MELVHPQAVGGLLGDDLRAIQIRRHVDRTDPYELLRIVRGILDRAGRRRHGCSMVLDFCDPPVALSGQQLGETLDLRIPEYLAFAQSVTKVDGALHIGVDGRLHGFACLLDGRSVPTEDRSRGARFNSALRFTAQNPDVIVVVESSDRPVSVIHGGVELSGRCEWEPFTMCAGAAPTLEEWLKK